MLDNDHDYDNDNDNELPRDFCTAPLAWPQPITAFDEDIAYSLLDWVLSHEL